MKKAKPINRPLPPIRPLLPLSSEQPAAPVEQVNAYLINRNRSKQ